MGIVQGEVEAGFEALREIFEQQFEKDMHIGAALSVYQHGRKVVDLWGGVADDETKRPWERDTMAVSYSTTKGLAAACIHVLADRGLLDYADPVSKYWPEFAQNGKAATTVYHVLTHQAGVPQVPASLASRDLLDWDRTVAAIAELPPLWEPGTATGYHALTFGWLTGELVRRIDGRSIGRFFAEEIAKPLGITELFIGAPASVEPKIAKLKSRIVITPAMQEQMAQFNSGGSLTARALGPSDGLLNDVIDSPEGHQAEIPAVNGVMSARDLARLYACYAGYGELDGVRLFSDERVRILSEQQTYRPDKVIILPIGWALGYMTGGTPGWPQGPRKTSFGHAGFGGSIGYADPEIGMSFGLVLNALAMDLVGAGRTASLADVARGCAEARM